MSPEIAVLRRLASTAAVAALVGDRLYQVKLPQRPTLPAIRVQLVDDSVGYHLRGEDGTVRARVQVDAYGADEGDAYTTVDTLAKAAHAALSGQRFTVGDGGSPEVLLEVTGAFRVARRVLYEADELRLLRIQQDYIVWSR